MGKKQKITKDMLISDIIEKYPQTIELFLDYGIHCLGCHMSKFETLEDGLKSHKIDIDKFVKELNDLVK